MIIARRSNRLTPAAAWSQLSRQYDWHGGKLPVATAKNPLTRDEQKPGANLLKTKPIHFARNKKILRILAAHAAPIKTKKTI